MKSGLQSTSQGGSLDTLAQTGTGVLENGMGIIQGDGSKFPGWDRLRAKTKRKVLAQVLAINFVSISDSNNQPERTASYWNTYHCQNRLVSHNGALFGKYCKNRFCPLCSSIRKATIINAYLPEMRSWKDPHFLTLTAKSVSKRGLKKRMKDMNRAFGIIKERMKKRHQRGKGPKPIGIKSLECNFNPVSKTYNPHFHLLVPDKETGELIKREWLKLWTQKFAISTAQKLVKVRDAESALVEVAKYSCKIFTEPDAKRQSRNKGKQKREIYIAALDNIFQAMQGLRIFERFGFNLPKQPKRENKTRLISNFKEWVFAPEVYDWINPEDATRLSGYIMPADLEYLLFERINVGTT